MTNSKILIIAGAVVVFVLATGAGVFFYISAMIDDASGPSSADFRSPYEDASWLLPAFEGEIGDTWLASTGKLSLSKGSVELVVQRDGVARRYTLSPRGDVMRRGGATLVAAEPFDLHELDLNLVTKLVADARERTGFEIGRVVVGRDEQGLLLWRAVPNGEASDVYYRADGSFVPDPDNP